ncbi:MAG: inositol monophosphatase family protein [Thermoplasmata archaeon]
MTTSEEVSDEPLDSPRRLREYLAVARTAARAGGARTLEHFGRRLLPDIKADGSPVTIADRQSEAAIRQVISDVYPEHAILGEEGGLHAGNLEVRWIVDPLDGTKSFIHGVPLYGVLIGVEVLGAPRVGVIYLPALHELVEAASGLGCWWNGDAARVSATAHLGAATVLTTSVRGLEDAGIPFRRLAAASRVQRGWGDCYGYALVATGRADVMIDSGVQIWDAAPLLPILEESGGWFTDWTGTPTILGKNAVGTNGRLHDAILRILRSEP